MAGIEPSISASESASIALQSLGSLGSLDLDSIYRSLFINELPWPVQVGIDTSVDFFSVLLLIRMAKLIGTDRDSIIASKVQQACLDYPGGNVVVVIGMLHCNGVGRWLMSGVDPLTFGEGEKGVQPVG